MKVRWGPIIPNGLGWEQFRLSPEENDLLDSIEWSARIICTALPDAAILALEKCFAQAGQDSRPKGQR